MPSFAIEVEGETTPLSVQDIFRVLSQTSGSGATQQSLQVATKQLANWEKTPGYYSLLQDIYSDLSVDDNIRLQAIIQLKNGIDKHWRKTSTNPIGKDEKQKIKSKAIDSGLQEVRPHLTLQNALMLSKIVRFEFPQDWPDVISTIIQHLRNATNNHREVTYVTNILNITLQIIKELASGRLIRTKRSLETVAPELLSVLGQLYTDLVQRWLSGQGDVRQEMFNSHSALKTLRRLLVVGFEHPHRDSTVKEFWQLLQQHHVQFWTVWTSSSKNDREISNLVARHLFQLSKLYLEMARQHPAPFVLLGCMDILTRSWSIISGNDAKQALSGDLDWAVHRDGEVNGEEESPIEKLSLKALLLFRACVKMVYNPVQTFKYHHPGDKEERKLAIESIKSQVFTDVFVLQLMEILVTQYFMLRPTDLRDWEQEPDEWERREEEIADAWEFSIRSCSEKLFLDLVINFKALLVPRLLQVFHQYSNIDNHDVLLKDSIYSAIGIAAACIEEILDFNSFIQNTLVSEVQMTRPNYNVLRRRTAIVLGQWVPIKPDKLDRVAIYQIFAFLLSTTNSLNDHVVRVTAGRQLRLVLEPFEFKFDDFQPYATPILENLMSLIQETELSETKMALLETVRVAVTKLESNIEPFARGIMSILPALWAESGEEHLMKQAILTMITAIITSLGKKGASYHESIYPLIHDSVQPESEAIVYLLEEALDLWAAILQQTPSDDPPPSSHLLSLSRSLLPLLEMGSEHLRQCFEILESYTILSPTTVFDPALLVPLLKSQKSILEMLASSRPRDASQGPHLLETLISTTSVSVYFTPESGTEAVQHLVSHMISTGYLPDLFRILKEAWAYHQDPRPNRRPPDIIGVGETSLFNLLATIALASPFVFTEAVSATGNDLNWLIQEWLGHFDSIGDAIRKKTQCLGLTNLLAMSSSAPSTILLESLQSVMTIWTDLLTELADGAADENMGDYLWSANSQLPDYPDDTPEDRRKRLVSTHDPAYMINARDFIAERLRTTIQACGGQERFERDWLSRIDGAVVKAFVELKVL